MRVFVLSAYLVVASAVDDEITKQQVLAALLTTEGLLFAGVSIAVSLAGGSTFGRLSAQSIRRSLAVVSVLILGAVAVAAGLAWTDLFAGSDWPDTANGRIEAGALLVAIIGQPTLAVIVAASVWNR